MIPTSLVSLDFGGLELRVLAGLGVPAGSEVLALGTSTGRRPGKSFLNHLYLLDPTMNTTNTNIIITIEGRKFRKNGKFLDTAKVGEFFRGSNSGDLYEVLALGTKLHFLRNHSASGWESLGLANTVIYEGLDEVKETYTYRTVFRDGSVSYFEKPVPDQTWATPLGFLKYTRIDGAVIKAEFVPA